MHRLTPNGCTQSGYSLSFGRKGGQVSSDMDHSPYEVEKSLLIFCMATETVAGLPNADLRCNTPALPRNLDDMAEAIVREEPPTLHPALEGLTRDPYLRWYNAKTATYVDVFIDNFLGLAQGPAHRRRRVWQTSFHALDKVFWPRDSVDSTN